MHWMQSEQPGLIPAHHILVVFHGLPLSFQDVQGDFHIVALSETQRLILATKQLFGLVYAEKPCGYIEEMTADGWVQSPKFKCVTLHSASTFNTHSAFFTLDLSFPFDAEVAFHCRKNNPLCFLCI